MKSKINNNAAPQAKKLCGAMKRAALTLLALIMTCATAWAETINLPYLDAPTTWTDGNTYVSTGARIHDRIHVQGHVTLELNSGYLMAYKGITLDWTEEYGIAVLTIKGNGYLDIPADDLGDLVCGIGCTGGRLYIEGGHISVHAGRGAAGIETGKLFISGGTIDAYYGEAFNEGDGYGINYHHFMGCAIGQGGALSWTGGSYDASNSTGGEITISGGTVNLHGDIGEEYYNENNAGNISIAECIITITGGTVNQDDGDYGYFCKQMILDYDATKNCNVHLANSSTSSLINVGHVTLVKPFMAGGTRYDATTSIDMDTFRGLTLTPVSDAVYSINRNTPEHGTVQTLVNGFATTTALQNQVVTVETEPEQGYQASVTVTGATLNGDTFTMPASNVTVTVSFTPAPEYHIYYVLNGGTQNPDNPATYYSTTGVPSFAAPSRTGYQFDHWYGNNNFTGGPITSIAPGTTGDQYLYANWTPNTYFVAFNNNGGSGTMAAQTHTYDASLELTSNTFTRTGYTFTGWATNPDGTGNTYTNGQSVQNLTTTNGATITLYAQWAPITYTVSFNNNGGDGTMSNQSFTYDVSQALTANTFTRTGYSFDGWATTAGGNVVYTNGQTVSNLASTQNANVTLYAKWSLVLSYFWGEGDGSEGDPYIISTAEGLNLLATLVNGGNNFSGKYFLQTADITLNGSFTPIGNYTTSNSNRKFSGTYDGGNNTISGLTISDNYLYAGLFGFVDIGGMVKNVRLVNPSVTSSFSGARVAALIGGADRCTVQNCLVVNPTVSATASSDKNQVGALIGSLSNATVQNCFVISPTVSGAGTNQVGAICGYAYNGGSTYHCTLTNVYYYNSSLGAIGSNNNGSYASLTNVGPARKVTLGSGMANVSPAATEPANGFVYDNVSYYREGLTLTLTDNLGTTSEGYTKHYYANGTDLNGSTTYTVNSTDGDVTFTAACRSNGQSYAVTYVDANGTEHSTSAIPLDGSMTTLNGTYYVGANITFTSTITLNYNTTLILANGKTMNVGTSDNRIPDEGIKGNKNRKHTLTIYGQSLDEATAGHLSIYNNDEGINLDSYNQQSGNVTVNSTTSNYTISCNSFTLSGGKLNAINNHTNGLGITGDLIRILGGQLDTYVSNNGYALTTLTGSITLGWTNATDHIYASRYDNCTINIASGQVFVTNDPTPDTITGNNIDRTRINGKILRPVLTGHGTTDDPYLITNAGGWDLFCDLVQNSIHTFQGNVKLCADISVSRMAGSESKPFCGNFDGQEYTITFNYNTGLVNDPIHDYIAPFRYVKGGIGNAYHHAIISNLYVDSHIIGENATHLAGLIANQKGLVDVTNCHVQAAITSTATTDSYCAGLVSHADLSDNYGNANDGTLSISGCTVSGSIVTYGKYAGGFVGMAEGKTSIVNSVSGVTIHSFVSGNGTHGGFIGLQQNTMNYNGVKTTIEGCLFNGKLIKSENTTQCGGFIGWHDRGELEIKHCLYAPADIINAEDEISDGSTFVGNGTVGFNCIYTRTLGTAQGKATHNITAGDEYVTISNIALISLTNPDVYNVSGITSYDYGGISCGDDLYICEDAYVSLVLSNDYPDPAPAGSVYGYTVSGGTLEDNGNGTYTLTMPNADITIEVDPTQTITLEWSGTGTESDPYMIYNKEQLDLVASRMYQHGYTYGSDQDYEGHPDGYFFKLGADIVYPYTSSTENNFTPIGNSYPYPSFQGTFDGDGHTISGIRINADYLSSNGYYFGCFGLFGEVAGTVKNVILADAVITGSSNLGGIVGNNYGTLENNLVIDATISTTYDNSHGSICGSNYGTLEHNYYVGCTVGEVENAIGVGCGSIEGDDYDYITADITDDDGAVPGNARTVEGYGDSEDNDHWVFIASPVATEEGIAPTAVGDLFPETEGQLNEYDLYRFDQSADKEWRNYKANTFVLENGQGYLYATKEDRTLVFVGECNTDTEPVDVPLTYNGTARLAGWNLVGNPFPRAAYITNMSYYKMSEDGSYISATPASASDYISPCTGVMVQATDENQSVTFSTTLPTQQSPINKGHIQLILSQSETTRDGASTLRPFDGPQGPQAQDPALLDNAIVSFDEGSQLSKFYFGKQNANLYIPQGGEKYAIVSIGNVGEIPVNFKANENGQYTITVNPENVKMSYLHLIDNMTGANVDLLATNGGDAINRVSTYTFEAKTTDYESRFKLVFVTNNEDGASTGSATFAFYSNGNWIIDNEGRATLQVIDLNGRVLRSETVNGSVSKSINQPAGVYMIRLINGDNVKVQKIVVK